MTRYVVSGWEAFENTNVVGISNDGKRIGMPCEDTESFSAWNGLTDESMWMMPMVTLSSLVKVVYNGTSVFIGSRPVGQHRDIV